MSFGLLFRRDAPDLPALTAVLQRAIDFSTRRGVLFVASAGNEDVNLNDPNFVRLPAGLDKVIAVGATGPINQTGFDRIASYSDVGRRVVDVFAPGGEVGFARNVVEDQILAACSMSIPGLPICRTGDVYVNFAGTSPAAAHVTGEAAVIESELAGNQSPAELTACILKTADPLPNPLLTGSGRINVLRGQEC
jgi:subtilisin family serine protease